MSQSYKCPVGQLSSPLSHPGQVSRGVLVWWQVPSCWTWALPLQALWWRLAPADWPCGLQLSQRSTVWGPVPRVVPSEGLVGWASGVA